MLRVSKESLTYFVGPEIEPVMEVPSGATVVFETVDCFSNKIRSPEKIISSYEQSLTFLPGWNPITGPVAVAGAKPGDCLSVEILEIKLPATGVTAFIPNLGMLASGYQLTDDLAPETKICRIEEGVVYLPTTRGEIPIPASPMIGTISVAPSQERIASFKFGAEHLGNVDCKEMTAGNTLIIPVNTEGALFGLGDVHAVQGDGEITAVAVEIAAEVTVKIDLIPAAESTYIACPQINSGEFIGSIGCHLGNDVSENIKHAYFDLIKRLEAGHGLTAKDAYHLLCQTGEVRVCQVLGDFQAALAKVQRRFID